LLGFESNFLSIFERKRKKGMEKRKEKEGK